MNSKKEQKAWILSYLKIKVLLVNFNAYSQIVNMVILNKNVDHVALLLRNNKNVLHVFEANSDDGVCIYTWDALL